MKVNLRPAVWHGLRQRLLRWSGRPWAEILLRALSAMLVSFLLAGVEAGGSFLPLSLSLAAALGLGIQLYW